MSEQELLSGGALGVFRLNGQFLAVAEELARPAGLTAARWQVLGAVLREPLPVSGIARAMGITRQSVQRIADLLVEGGLAEYRANPAHRRAKLLTPTPEGRAAIARIDPGHAAYAHRLAAAYGEAELAAAVAALERLSEVLDELGPPEAAAGPGPLAAPAGGPAARSVTRSGAQPDVPSGVPSDVQSVTQPHGQPGTNPDTRPVTQP